MEKIKEGFESERYTFDVCVTQDVRVKLLDFNPWGACESTLVLLLLWISWKRSWETRAMN